jgi:hypothetical protein
VVGALLTLGGWNVEAAASKQAYTADGKLMPPKELPFVVFRGDRGVTVRAFPTKDSV